MPPETASTANDSFPPHAAASRGQKAAPDAPTEAEVRAAFRGSPHAFLDAGDSRLAYYRFGSGPDLVFVHGWPLHAATFRRVVPRLADAFTCHLFDLPGTGQTETRPEAVIDLRSHARTVRRAIDELGLDRYALCAHDSGGFVAREVAADDERALGLVLGNTEIPGHSSWIVALWALMAKSPFGAGLLRTMMSSRLVRRSPLGLAGCFTDLAYADGEFHDLFIEPLIRSERVASGQMRLLKSLSPHELERLTPIHGRIRAPVRLVWGTEDPFFPIAKARRMLTELGGRADLQEIPGGKVFAHEDHAEEFAAWAKPFLLECMG